jgi:hypothetical protein
MQFFTVIFSALSLAVSTTATPHRHHGAPTVNIDFTFDFTAPRESDTWVAGTEQLVAWNASYIPPNNGITGNIYLQSINGPHEGVDFGKLLPHPARAPRRLDRPLFTLADWKTWFCM